MLDFDRRVRERLDVETVEYSAEPKIDGLAISLRYERRPARAGGDPRRRHQGRGRHRQRAHDPLRAARAARRRLPTLLEVRGEVFMPRRSFEQLNRRAAEQRREDLRQSAQRRGRQPAPARPAGHREPAARPVLLRRRRDRRLDAAAPAQRGAGGAARAGPAHLPGDRRWSPGVDGLPRVLRAHGRGGATRSATRSTASSTRSTASTGSATSASSRARRAGRSRTSSRRRRRRRSCATSSSRSAAPAR